MTGSRAKLEQALRRLGDVLYRRAPKWTSIELIKARPLEDLSKLAALALPIAATAIPEAQKLALMSPAAGHTLVEAIPEELFLAYLISVFYALGSIIFDVFCPAEIKRHKSFSAYAAALSTGGAALPPTSGEGGPASARSPASTVEIDPEALARMPLVQLEQMFRTVAEQEAERSITPVTSWLYLERKHALLRLASGGCLGASILLTLFVVGWTTPRHVFLIKSFWQVVGYLFG